MQSRCDEMHVMTTGLPKFSISNQELGGGGGIVGDLEIKPHTEGTEAQSFSEHRGELTLAGGNTESQ